MERGRSRDCEKSRTVDNCEWHNKICEVLHAEPVHRRQRNNNWTRQKRGSPLFLLFRKVISPFRVLNTPLAELILNNEIKCACFTSFYLIFYVFWVTRWDMFVFVFFFPFFLATRFPVELHRSKPLISLVPFNLHFHCFQGYGHCYVTIPIVFPANQKQSFI